MDVHILFVSLGIFVVLVGVYCLLACILDSLNKIAKLLDPKENNKGG